MIRSRAIALATALLALACDRTVEDGQWTFTWRLDGREVTSSSAQRYASCAESSTGVELARSLRAEKHIVCSNVCPALDAGGDDARACVLRCDAAIAFVSARCEPTSHKDPIPIFAR